MFLNQALTQLRNLKSKAKRTEGYINECATHYEDETPEYVYATEMEERARLNNQILKLKTAIQITNATTTTTFNGRRVTLAELVLMNADVRTEMAFLAKQAAHTTDTGDSWRSSGRTKDNVKKVFAYGCEKKAFKAQLDKLELEKEQIEAAISTANSTTQLVEGY